MSNNKIPKDWPRPIVETLEAARDLILDPKRWTQGRGEPCFQAARDAEGNACQPDDPRAVAWCATGAIAKVEPTIMGLERAERALGEALVRARLGAGLGPVWFNDHRSHADVIEMFDVAIWRQREVAAWHVKYWEEEAARQRRIDYWQRRPSEKDIEERRLFVSKFIGEVGEVED